MRVLGVDPAPAAVKTARERGVETLQTFFTKGMGETIRRERGPVAVVTANNVMANIDDLDDLIQGVRAMIEPDGYFVFETGYGLDLFRNRLIDNVYHEHISYFSILPLSRFFERLGMKIIDARPITTKGGSIRCVVQTEQAVRQPNPSVREMIVTEQFHHDGQLGPCRELNASIGRTRQELRGLLSQLRAKGRTVAGYGASIGVTTLLYLFGLDEYLDCLYDDNPVVCGRFSPGHHIPVLDSREIYQRKPDHILILAWRYTDPIMKRHAKYVDQGGRFITCLPDVSVLEPS